MEHLWSGSASRVSGARDIIKEGFPVVADALAGLSGAFGCLPEGATVVFGADVCGTVVPVTVLAGDRVLLLDVVDDDSPAFACGRGDRLAAAARRLSLFHKPSDGMRIHCAVVYAKSKKAPQSVLICQMTPIERLGDYFKKLDISGADADASAWLAGEVRGAFSIVEEKIDQGVKNWIKLMMDGWLSDAASEMQKLLRMGYRAYTTADYSAAKEYCRARYAGTDALYGFLVSTEAENMFPYGGKTSATRTKRLPKPEDEGWEERWFVPDSGEDACTNFKRAAFEDTVADKRIDFSVLGWGDDMRWTGRWKSKRAGFSGIGLDFGSNKALVKENTTGGIVDGRAVVTKGNYRRDAYEKLLFAAKDGLIIFTVSGMYVDTSRNTLIKAGVQKFF